METLTETAFASPPSLAASLRSIVESVRRWLDDFLQLAALEWKQAGIWLALMVCFGLGAFVLVVAGWFALLGCAVAALVENNIFGWVGSLWVVALLNFVGAGGLVLLAIQRSKHLLFYATRRQLGLQSATVPHHD